MDLSKLSRGQVIAGAGGLLLVLSLFLGWVSVFGGTQTAFDAFSGMDIIMLVIGAAAVAFAALTASEASIDLPGNAAVILAVLGVLVVGWALGWVLEEPSAGFGAWLGLIGACAIAYGSWEAHRSPIPMAVTRPRPGPSPDEKPASQATASAAQATASAAEATASAAQGKASAPGEQTRRHDSTTVEQPAATPPRPRGDTAEETVEQPAAAPRPRVPPGGEADTIAPRPSAPPPNQPRRPPGAPERSEGGSSEPGGS